jgi:type VI protein secretion system component Hcp
MASNSACIPLRRLFGVAALLLANSGTFAWAADTELMLCGGTGSGSGGAGLIDTLAGPNPQAPPGASTVACVPLLRWTEGSAAIGGGGGGGGGLSRRFDKINVLRTADANSARFADLVASGAPVQSLALLRTRSDPLVAGGARLLSSAMVLTDVSVDGVQTSLGSGDGRPLESLVLNFRRVNYLYWNDPQTNGPPSAEFCWNLQQNQQC